MLGLQYFSMTNFYKTVFVKNKIIVIGKVIKTLEGDVFRSDIFRIKSLRLWREMFFRSDIFRIKDSFAV
jgi:hypothetical protein